MNKKLQTAFRAKRFKDLLKRNKVQKIAIFGSMAKGNGRRGSDIDFLVEFKKDADLLDQAGLKIDLEQYLSHKVDVVTPKGLSKYIRRQVLKEAIYL